MRVVLPWASCCNRNPSCPRRTVNSIDGSLASAPQVRMPHESRIASCSASGERTSSGKAERNFSSSPSGTTVAPVIPFAISKAVSGLQAMATFNSNPIERLRLRIAVAIFLGGPKSFPSPSRSSVTAPAAVDSTRGEKCKPHSSSAACARCSHSADLF